MQTGSDFTHLSSKTLIFNGTTERTSYHTILFTSIEFWQWHIALRILNISRLHQLLCIQQGTQFYVHVTVHSNKFIFNKTNRRTNLQNLFCQETLHVSGIYSAHHQEFSTVHSVLVYVMQLWWQLSSTTRMELILVKLESCHRTCMTYTSTECTVENSWWWAEEMPETCRVSWQNKFGKLACLLVSLKRKRNTMFIPV
jgi:hypothetical protein